MTQQITQDTASPSVYLAIVGTDGTAKDDALAAGLNLWYQRARGVKTNLVLSDLGDVDSAYSAGGVVNIGSEVYRLDLPAAAVISGVSSLAIGGTCDDGVVIGVTVQIVPATVTPSNAADTTAIKAVTDKLDGMIEDDGGDQFTEKALSQAPSGGGGGGEIDGANTVTITVDDGENPVDGARVRVTLGVQSQVKLTDAAGEVAFTLDDGTWSVGVTRIGYVFDATSLVVSGETDAAYSMTQIVPTPVDAPWINAQIQCYDAAGNVLAGAEVRIAQVTPTTFGGIASGDDVRVIVADSNGVASAAVLLGGSYRVWYLDSSGGRYREFRVPEHAVDGFLITSVIG